MKLVAPLIGCREWLKGLQEQGYVTVAEAEAGVGQCEMTEAEKANEAARGSLIDPRKINVFEGGHDDG